MLTDEMHDRRWIDDWRYIWRQTFQDQERD